MSIKKIILVNTATVAYDFGITISTGEVSVEVDLAIVSCAISGNDVTAQYSIMLNGQMSAVTRNIKFAYNGGDINSEAEIALSKIEKITMD